jgi:O-methyltransferase involved in polyketide biosynthesis
VDADRPVLFWWLGVTPYLTVEAVTATLTTLGSLPHSAVVLDPGRPTPTPVRRREPGARGASNGSPPSVSPGSASSPPDALATLLERCGFEHVHLEDEVALIRRILGRPQAGPDADRRVTHLALATTGWPPARTGQAVRS